MVPPMLLVMALAWRLANRLPLRQMDNRQQDGSFRALKMLIRQLVSGTRLEGPARAFYRALRGTPAALAAPPDGSILYDMQAASVMERVLDRRSNCIDVGFHLGAILDLMLRFSPEGEHYGFEPLPHLYSAAVQRYAGAGNVHLYEVALSDAPGIASFQYVVSNPAYSGLLKRRFDRPHEDVQEIQVRLLRLDDVLPRGFDIRLMKIDVEGAELQVLRGSMETLRRCRPFVIFEHGLGAADVYGTRPETVFDLLTGCGLRVALMSDWLAASGRKVLSRESFGDEFNSARNYYFLAHP
jgi:FkbM family methyltransferase